MADALGVAVGGVQTLRFGGEAAEVALEVLQLDNALADLVRTTFEQRDHVRARGLAAFSKGDDLADLTEGQPDRLRGPDERKAVDGRVVVVAIARGRALWRVQHADVLVVADGLHRDTRAIRELTDAHHISLCPLTFQKTGRFAVP
jgi:hypothetical protein